MDRVGIYPCGGRSIFASVPVERYLRRMNARWTWLALGVAVAGGACSSQAGSNEATGAGPDPSDAAASAASAAADGATCAQPGVTRVGVTFVNQRASAVTLYWIDARCSEVAMGTLAAGRSTGIGTFVGHRFRVREGAGDPAGAVVREWSAAESDVPSTTVVIDPAPGQAPVRCSVGGTLPATLRVTNQTTDDLSLFWVDGQCNEVFRGAVDKGQSTGESTFVGHVFRVRAGTANAPGALVREIVVGSATAADAGTSDAATDAGSASNEVVIAPADGGAPVVCSGPGTTPLTLTVKNGGAAPVSLFWLDGKCSPQLKETIAAGASASESSYAGHVFQVRDGANQPGGTLREQILLGPNDAPTKTVTIP